MIIVWGSIEALGGSLEEVTRLSLEHVRRSRTEPGCISHSVQADVENPSRLIFFEEWQDMVALQTHFAVPESGQFVQQVSELAAAPPDIKIFESTPVG
ncbi:MAG: putative quinol monooxygenase [Halieaceae bacterium]